MSKYQAHCVVCADYLTKPPRRQEIHSIHPPCSWCHLQTDEFTRRRRPPQRGVMQPDSTGRPYLAAAAPAFNFQRPWRKWPELTTDAWRAAGWREGEEGCVRRDDRPTDARAANRLRKMVGQELDGRSAAPCVRRSVSPVGNQLRSGFQREWRRMVRSIGAVSGRLKMRR